MRDQFIVTVFYFLLILFGILLFMLIRNIVKYVIGMKRYKELRIIWFYLLAVSIVLLRVIDNVMILIRNSQHSWHHKQFEYRLWIVSYSCRKLENMLGLQQLVSMIDF